MEQTTMVSPAGKARFYVKILAIFSALLLLLGTLPLYTISLYNHPYYDDYGFSSAVHDVWVQTHSFQEAFSAAVTSTKDVRNNWQGTYTGTFLSNLQPGVFSENLYWVTTFFLLTAFLLCFGFFITTVSRHLLHIGKAETVILVCLSLFLMTQFLPDASEAFFWFNGGVGNTFIYSLLALSLALTIRFWHIKQNAPGLILALAALTTLLGGGSYGGGLFGLLIFVTITVVFYRKKNSHRFDFAGLTFWFLLCFLYSISAAGNTVRASMIGADVGVVKAVLQSLYYGMALLGSYTTLPVLAVGLVLSPILWKAAKQSPFSFQHPIWVLLLAAGVYCAQLTPPLYSGVFIGGGRITDTYYYSYIMLFLFAETYVLGALARRRERLSKPAPALTAAGQKGLILVSACLLAIGCIGYKPNDETLYGPMHMAGGAAALSILTGEAAQYDREMTAREALLNDATQSTVTLSPLTAVPSVFMDDLLSPDAAYDVLPVLSAYYHKDAIIVEGGETP